MQCGYGLVKKKKKKIVTECEAKRLLIECVGDEISEKFAVAI